MNLFRSLAFLGAALVISGCSPARNELPRGTVKGRVTMSGKAVPDAMITFQNDAISVAQGASTDSDGKYEFITYDKAGLPAASYKVTVNAGKFLQEGESVYNISGGGAPAARKTSAAVPAKYAAVDTSGLSADVKEGDNPPFDFDLEP